MKLDPQSVAQSAQTQAAKPACDDASLTSLYRRWRNPLVRLFQGRSRDREQAEDATQDLFVRMAVSGKTLGPEEERPYLSTVARSVATDNWRKSGRDCSFEAVSMETACEELESLRVDDALSPLEVAAHRQRIARLNEAVAELPERQRQAFLLNRVDGLSHDDVAAVMGISPRMVAKHLNRAMAYCHLRVKYGSVEQMQRLHTIHDLSEEGAVERKDAP